MYNWTFSNKLQLLNIHQQKIKGLGKYKVKCHRMHRFLHRICSRIQIIISIHKRIIRTVTGLNGSFFFCGRVPFLDVCFAYQVLFATRRTDTTSLTQCSTPTIGLWEATLEAFFFDYWTSMFAISSPGGHFVHSVVWPHQSDTLALWFPYQVLKMRTWK